MYVQCVCSVCAVHVQCHFDYSNISLLARKCWISQNLFNNILRHDRCEVVAYAWVQFLFFFSMTLAVDDVD